MKKTNNQTNIHWCERRDMSAATQQEMRSAMWVSKRKLQEIMMEERGRREKEKKKDANKLVKEDCIAEEERKTQRNLNETNRLRTSPAKPHFTKPVPLSQITTSCSSAIFYFFVRRTTKYKLMRNSRIPQDFGTKAKY